MRSSTLSLALGLAVVLAVVLPAVIADMYMHNPRGCNDRNRERRQNRDNGNRIYDTQNNAAGGYAHDGDATVKGIPDPLTFYRGSHLRLEWTNQHGCGNNPNVHCEVVVQWACEREMPGLRDGYPNSDSVVQSDDQVGNNPKRQGYLKRLFSGEGGQNQDGTERIPEGKPNEFYALGLLGGVEFGYHESVDSYNLCKATTRNLGLYVSDQKVGTRAVNTRQNPNGGRRGLECPEERDYYPYWRPTQWVDAAVLTNNLAYCEYFQDESENVKPRGYCDCTGDCRNNKAIPITNDTCRAQGGSWRVAPARNFPKPDCRLHDFSRDNHLGNALEVDDGGNIIIGTLKQPETAHYNWQIPSEMEGLCVLRMRYNMSTGDYPNQGYKLPNVENLDYNQAYNCPRISLSDNQNSQNPDDYGVTGVEDSPCIDKLTATSRPLYNRPYVQLFADNDPKLSLAINTHQTGRTFQDRSYVFRVTDAPDGVDGGRVWNLNVRGRRGNIVQSYPSVEYDFTPTILEVPNGHFIHFQVAGTDFNADRNANNGEGWRYSCRSNMVETENGQLNYPRHQSQMRLFTDINVARKFALLGQKNCDVYKNGDEDEQNAFRNCGKLNSAPARYPVDPAEGLIQMSNQGHYYYMSTRNNNFSNRSHKGQIIVGPEDALSTAAIIGIVVGSVAGVALIASGVLWYGKKHPGTVAGKFYDSTVGKIGGGSSKAPAPQMDYQRRPGRI